MRAANGATDLESVARAIIKYIISPFKSEEIDPITFIIATMEAEYNVYNNYSYLMAPLHYVNGNRNIADIIYAFAEDLKQLRDCSVPRDSKIFASLERMKLFFTQIPWSAASPHIKLISALLSKAAMLSNPARLQKMLLEKNGADFVSEFDVVIRVVRRAGIQAYIARVTAVAVAEAATDDARVGSTPLVSPNAQSAGHEFFNMFHPSTISRALRDVASSFATARDEDTEDELDEVLEEMSRGSEEQSSGNEVEKEWGADVFTTGSFWNHRP
jgi:hypothetical protein